MMPVLSIGNVALNKAADRYPEFQQIVAQAAKNNNKEEKEAIENFAKVLLVSTIGQVYYNTRKNPRQKREELLLE
ncbi:hypothetical protein P3S68_004516 [Capsicum galapagoense]